MASPNQIPDHVLVVLAKTEPATDEDIEIIRADVNGEATFRAELLRSDEFLSWLQRNRTQINSWNEKRHAKTNA